MELITKLTTGQKTAINLMPLASSVILIGGKTKLIGTTLYLNEQTYNALKDKGYIPDHWTDNG